MKTFFSFKPEHFNNNGDQGNLDVLRFFLQAQGLQVSATDEAAVADFVLVGDASRAAISHHEQELTRLIPVLSSRIAKGLPTLLVGSSYEFFLGKIAELGTHARTTRVSEFRSVALTAELTVMGYRNSELASGDVQLFGGFIATTLYGPILAKNPELLDLVLLRFGAEKAKWPKDMLEFVTKIRSEISSD